MNPQKEGSQGGTRETRGCVSDIGVTVAWLDHGGRGEGVPLEPKRGEPRAPRPWTISENGLDLWEEEATLPWDRGALWNGPRKGCPGAGPSLRNPFLTPAAALLSQGLSQPPPPTCSRGGVCWDLRAWHPGAGRDLPPRAPGSPRRHSPELCVGTCTFLNSDFLPAAFPRCCHRPSSNCHMDKSSFRVLGGRGWEKQSLDLGRVTASPTCFLVAFARHPATKPDVQSPRPSLCVPTCSPRPRPVPSASLATAFYLCGICHCFLLPAGSALSIPRGKSTQMPHPPQPPPSHPPARPSAPFGPKLSPPATDTALGDNEELHLAEAKVTNM